MSLIDPIDRNAAIDKMSEAIWHYPNELYPGLNEYTTARRLAEFGLNSVPPVQPEIVRCHDCISYQEGIDIDGKPFTRCNGSVRTYGQTLPDWYCADGERRTDESDK